MTDAPAEPTDAPAATPAPGVPGWGWPGWLDIGLAVGLSPVLIAIVRLLAYAAGDPVALKVLVGTLDVRAILLGSILPIVPALLFSVANYLLVARAVGSWEVFGIGRGLLVGVCAVGLLAYAWLGPLPQALISIAALGVTLAVVQLVLRLLARRRRSARRRWRIPLTRPRRLLLLLVPVVGLAIVFVLPQGMWLPAEQVTLADGSVHRGYVLELTSSWATVMDERRVVEILPAQQISARSLCDQGVAQSLALLVTRPAGVPTTPVC